MFPLPDLPTVLAVCCVINLVLGCGLLLVHRTSKTYPGFSQWVAAAFSVFLYGVLLAFRGAFPSLLFGLLGHVVLFMFPLLVARGFRQFAGLPAKNWISWAAAVGLLAIFVTFGVWRPDPQLRGLFFSLLVVPLFLDCSVLTGKVRSLSHPAVRIALGITFALVALWSLIGVPVVASLRGWPEGTAPGPIVQSLTITFLTAANAWICLGFVLLHYARASESLRDSEERFRNLSGAAFEGIVFSEGNRLVEANEQALRLLGYTREELLGCEVGVLTAPGTPSLMTPVANAGAEMREYVLERKDGSTIAAEAQTKMSRLGSRPVRIIALHDLSERNRMRQELAESEERFRSAMHRAPIGMAIVGTDGRWLEVNPALCALVGYTREQLLGRDTRSITHPDDRLTDEQSIGRLLSRAIDSYKREKRYVHQTGHEVWVNVHVSAVWNADGSPRHLVSQIIDVTERKRTEEALREYQARLRQAMDVTKLGHWELDPTAGRFTLDESFYKLLGTSAAIEGTLEMSMDDYTRRFLPPDEIPRLQEVVARALVEQEPGGASAIEHRFFRTDGSAGVMAVRFAVERDAEGRTIRVFGLSQDVTEQSRAAEQRRLLEEQLRQAQKMDALGTLAGGIAHDFNNILTGIMGNLDLAALELPAGHAAQVRLQDARQASRRARDHVARILTFSRRHQGERQVRPLGPVVQEAAQLLRASLPVTIEIRTRFAPDCPPILCDAAQIHQVVMNLGTNAAHAMRNRGGILSLDVEPTTPDRTLRERHPQVKPEHRVRLVVRDTGTGMDAAVLARIFEPFFTTKAPDEGTGLGLAMVHGIVQDHQGAIVVNSVVGHGTTFALYFPAARDAGISRPAAASSTAGESRPFGGGRKVMIVDDDSTVLRLGNDILHLAGFVSEPFAKPLAALKRFEAGPEEYAAVVSDLTMPGLTGLELARRFRQIRPDIVFILTSGNLQTDARGGAQESGISHFIRKPFDVAEFSAKLREALGEQA